jgi:hypothetical protein
MPVTHHDCGKRYSPLQLNMLWTPFVERERNDPEVRVKRRGHPDILHLG